jgi:hypothetical protein
MPYTVEQTKELDTELGRALHLLEDLKLKVVVQGQPLDASSRLREHLLHGAGRRIGVIRRSIQNVFSLFPPDTERPLSSDALADVQINLHAFVMNLYGIYDNWAWAYVLRHDLEAAIGDRRKVGLFQEATRKRLPKALRDYLSSPTTTEWHQQYAKSFRDALAHRIPPYMPPAQFTPKDGKRYNDLENEKVECIKDMRWERLDQIWSEQAGLGTPCFTFLHAYNEDTPTKPLLLHPQMLSDAMAVTEFGDLFLQHWHEAS